jgi:hypothetical protein
LTVGFGTGERIQRGVQVGEVLLAEMVFEEFVDFGAEGSLEGGKVFADGGFEVVILVEFSLQKVFVDLNEGEGRYA